MQYTANGTHVMYLHGKPVVNASYYDHGKVSITPTARQYEKMAELAEMDILLYDVVVSRLVNGVGRGKTKPGHGRPDTERIKEVETDDDKDKRPDTERPGTHTQGWWNHTPLLAISLSLCLSLSLHAHPI